MKPEPGIDCEICECMGCTYNIHIACGQCGMAICGDHAFTPCGADGETGAGHWHMRKPGVPRRIIRLDGQYVSLADLDS